MPWWARKTISCGKTSNPALSPSCGDLYRYLGKGDLYQYDFSDYYASGTYETAFAGEKAITTAINYCISGKIPKLYVLGGHGEPELSQSYRNSIQRENMELASLTLFAAH